MFRVAIWVMVQAVLLDVCYAMWERHITHPNAQLLGLRL